jgi:hypothetical protein
MTERTRKPKQSGLKVSIHGKDDAPLSMQDLQQGFTS